MKTAKSLLLLTLAALGLTGSLPAEGTAQKEDKATQPDHSAATVGGAEEASPSATVSAQLGQFYFPIKNITRQWEWQAAPANACEYNWSVSLPLGDETYQLGFSRFCVDPKAKEVGTFEELIASGQVSIWKKNAKGGASLEQSLTRITAKRQGDGLLIELKEPKLLAKLLAERPATLGFESVYGTYPSAPQRDEVTVNYK